MALLHQGDQIKDIDTGKIHVITEVQEDLLDPVETTYRFDTGMTITHMDLINDVLANKKVKLYSTF